MVTLRARGTGDADQSGRRRRQQQQQSPVRTTGSPLRASPETRTRSTDLRPEEPELSDGFNGEDEDQNQADSETPEDEEDTPARAVIRKSKRLQTAAGGAGPRRSTRPTKQTSRYQASNIFDGISTSTSTGWILKTMDDLKKKRLLSNNEEGASNEKIQRSRTPVAPQKEPSDSQDQHGGVAGEDDSGQEVAPDDDSSCGAANHNFDAKLSRASALYRGPGNGRVLHRRNQKHKHGLQYSARTLHL